jgi:hypothetical protein
MIHDASTGPGTSVAAVAWYGRVASTDPTCPAIALRRQADACRRALPDGFHIVAFYFDVHLGTAVAAEPSHPDGPGTPEPGTARPGAGGIRRDGGLIELMEAARRPDPAFVAVVCESIDQISPSQHLAARIDCELDRGGVTLLTAEEGISPGGASALVGTRHLRQAIAEWYLMPMLDRLSVQDAHIDPHAQDVLREVAERIDQAGGSR